MLMDFKFVIKNQGIHFLCPMWQWYFYLTKQLFPLQLKYQGVWGLLLRSGWATSEVLMEVLIWVNIGIYCFSSIEVFVAVGHCFDGWPVNCQTVEILGHVLPLFCCCCNRMLAWWLRPLWFWWRLWGVRTRTVGRGLVPCFLKTKGLACCMQLNYLLYFLTLTLQSWRNVVFCFENLVSSCSGNWSEISDHNQFSLKLPDSNSHANF